MDPLFASSSLVIHLTVFFYLIMIYKTKIKTLRKIGCKIPSFTKKKMNKRKSRPGEHSFFYLKKTSLKGLFAERLKNKQKLKLIFCINERQLKNYIKVILGFDKRTPFISLYNLLQMRFDYLLYSLNFTKTILQARQLITHGCFFLNGIKQTRPGYICKVNTLITTTSSLALKNLNQYLKNRVYIENLKDKSEMCTMKVEKPKILDLELLRLIRNAFEFYL